MEKSLAEIYNVQHYFSILKDNLRHLQITSDTLSFFLYLSR